MFSTNIKRRHSVEQTYFTIHRIKIMNNEEKIKWDALYSELHKAKAALHMLSTTVLGGVAKLSIDDGLCVLTASEGYYRMTGYTEKEFHAPPLSGYASKLVHQEDVPVVTATVEKVVRDDTQVSCTYRILQKDGTIAWNTAYCAQVEQTELGLTVDVFFRDITEERNRSKENTLNEERFRIISEQTRDTVYEWDIQADKIMFSPVFEKMFGYPPPMNASIERVLQSDITHPADRIIAQKMMLDVQSESSYLECEHRIIKKDGGSVWCRNRAMAIFDDEHRPIRIIGILTDIDDYKKNTLQLVEQAERDSLTGLLNRMTMQRQIERNLEQNTNQLCAYIQLDIDHFKQINDFMGHGAGDIALLQISSYLTKHFSESSIVSRPGGDEFAVYLLDQPSVSAIRACVSELCNAVRCDFAVGEKVYPLSVSIGVSLFPKNGTTFTELYSHADDALYQAKRQGGNNFVFFSET